MSDIEFDDIFDKDFDRDIELEVTEDEKLVVYLKANYKIKDVKIDKRDGNLILDSEYGLLKYYLPCPAKKVDEFKNEGSGLYIIKVTPKWKGYLPKSFDENFSLYDILKPSPIINPTERTITCEVKINSENCDPELLREILEDELEEIKELIKGDELDDTDEITDETLNDEDDEDEEDNSYWDLYEYYEMYKHDGIVVDLEDDYDYPY